MMLNQKNIKMAIAGIFLSAMMASCGEAKPEPVKLNVDNCQHCKMTVADLKFATELITAKGRIYKFDDLKCMVAYRTENNIEGARFFVTDYKNSGNLIKVEAASFVSGPAVSSPMNGNVAAFSKREDAQAFATEKGAGLTAWEEVNK